MYDLTVRELFTLQDIASTKAAMRHGVLPCVPEVPAQTDRINAACVRFWLVQIAEVSRVRR